MRLSRRISLRQLEIFCEAARRLNFSEVAEVMALTQPAVSMQLRELEDAVGLPLFERVGRHKALTEAGRRLLGHASRVLAELRDAEEAMQAMRGLALGSITVGLVSTANSFAPRLLATFSRRHPGIDVSLVVANRENLVHLLKENQVDLVIMGRPPGELETQAEPLAENPHVLIAPPGHRLAGRAGLDLQELAGETFLERESGSGTRAVMEDLFRVHLFRPARLLTLGSNETIKQAVMAGLGLSLLSLHTLGLELKSGELTRLDVLGLPLMRTWHVVHLARRQLPPAAVAFRRFLIEETQGYLGTAFAGLT